MTRVVFAACLLMATSLAGPWVLAKDPTPLPLQKGARIGIVNMLDAEVSHFHTSKVLAESFFKTHLVNWQVDSMLSDSVAQRLSQLELVPVTLGASDALMRGRDDTFVNNSVVKGLPREASKEFAQLAASEHLDALIVLAPGLNNSSQAGGALKRGLPDYLRGWGFITGNANEAPSLFNMTQALLIAITPEGAALRAREWGGAYTDEWPDYVPAANPKQIPPEQLDKLQPLFARILARQTNRLLDWITVAP